MLILILFWVALVVAIISWIGSIAENRPDFTVSSVLFLALAFFAAVVDRASWL